MKSLSPYLVFNGNCREAMTFYQHCLGGELYFQTIGESSTHHQMTDRMRNCVLHASLASERINIAGSDIVGDLGLIRGNAVALLLQCNDERELRSLMNELSEGGEMCHGRGFETEGEYLIDFSDKFGTHWILHCSQKK